MQDFMQMDLRQMHSALEAAAQGVTPAQLAAIERFVEQIGGLDNARDAVQLLQQMEGPAPPAEA